MSSTCWTLSKIKDARDGCQLLATATAAATGHRCCRIEFALESRDRRWWPRDRKNRQRNREIREIARWELGAAEGRTVEAEHEFFGVGERHNHRDQARTLRVQWRCLRMLFENSVRQVEAEGVREHHIRSGRVQLHCQHHDERPCPLHEDRVR